MRGFGLVGCCLAAAEAHCARHCRPYVAGAGYVRGDEIRLAARGANPLDGLFAGRDHSIAHHHMRALAREDSREHLAGSLGAARDDDRFAGEPATLIHVPSRMYA